MERDILDDYRDFILEHFDNIEVDIRLIKAEVDEDGDIQQQIHLRFTIPGYGRFFGGGVFWVPEQMFPHPEYDEPCEEVMDFTSIFAKRHALEGLNLFDVLPPLDNDDSNIDLYG